VPEWRKFLRQLQEPLMELLLVAGALVAAEHASAHAVLAISR
jgi:hypothetical protein